MKYHPSLLPGTMIALALATLEAFAQSTYEPYTFTTLAGVGPGNADGTGSAARFNYPTGVAVDGAGNVYVGDTWNNSSPLPLVPPVIGMISVCLSRQWHRPNLLAKPARRLAFPRPAGHPLAMPAQNQRPWPGSGGPTQFTTTHWSVVLAAADNSSPDAQAALEELCRTYWFPLYAFVRRRGLDPHTAQDVVQGFFAQLLERQSFRNRTPEQGRFRSFLLASLKYYLADLADYEHAAKRGGGQAPIALDALEAEERYRLEPADQLTPEKLFERRWALTLLANVLGRLENEFADSERAELFRQLRPTLFDKQPEGSYESVAASLKMTPGAVRVAAHRIRQRCRELFREAVAQTVNDPSEIEEELRYLRRVIAG